MNFFRFVSVPGASWPAVPSPNTAPTAALYHELRRTERLSAEEIEAGQLVQLRALLRHAFECSPYYRALFFAKGFDPKDLRSLAEYRSFPFLTREIYRERMKEMIATSLPPGTTLAKDPQFTSGTSGVPIPVFKTNHEELWWTALTMRDLEWSGIDPTKRIAGIRLIAKSESELRKMSEGIRSNAILVNGEKLFASVPSFGLDVRTDPKAQLSWLLSIRPSFLISFPSNLVALATLAREAHLRVPLEGIQAISEPLTDETKKFVEETFGCPVRSSYSTTECGYIASPCPTGSGFHVHSENVLAEVLGEDDEPVGPGESGRLVFTALHAFGVPLLRYEIQDVVTLAAEACPCGRGLPLWSRVDGRKHPMLSVKGGQRSSIGITQGLRQIGGVAQFQFHLREKGRAVVRAVPDASWTAEHPERIRRLVQTEFGEPIEVEIEEVSHLGPKSQMIVVEEAANGG